MKMNFCNEAHTELIRLVVQIQSPSYENWYLALSGAGEKQSGVTLTSSSSSVMIGKKNGYQD